VTAPPPQTAPWHYGSLFVYSLACFFIGLLTGLLRIPGILPVGIGAVVGAWAAWRRWFELTPPPGG
jgi:hypothetical protein